LELKSIKQRFGIIGNSVKLNRALEIAKKVAPTDLSVLISGESGVGKEAFSKIIHQLSVRKHSKFIALNCGAIPEGTIDSELFGHTKGSFTGATDNRKGYFETANGGTIFLDEIGEMPIGTQARLLRVLESGEFIPVGDSKVSKTDVRIVAATNKNLIEKVKQGKFREDLYFRLNTVPIQVPALRERGQDIELLFRKFVTDFSETYHTKPVILTNDAIQILLAYRWPGNVRQLKNVAEQISVLSKDDLIASRELSRFLPEQENSLMVQNEPSISEREILYKMLFEMKQDLNNIRKYLWNNGHQEFFKKDESELPVYTDSPTDVQLPFGQTPQHPQLPSEIKPVHQSETVLLDEETDYYEEESFEESLSIADMEKELIIKALKKHKGIRKKASLDLGISERTLYRKLKEYEIDG